MDILVTYDIETVTTEGEARLRRVAKVCERFGTRVQYSVFECRVSAPAFERLVYALRRAIEPDCDSVHIYRFDGSVRPARMSLGRTVPHEVGDPWIV